VGNALSIENELSDWRLVSFRIVPCSPLSNSTKKDPAVYCWPEVRLVWQPVVTGQVIPRRTLFYAEDRAIHALFNVHPSAVFTQDVAKKALLLLSKVNAELKTGIPSLSTAEFKEFTELRNKLSASLVSEAMGLRELNDDELYRKIDLRPEFQDTLTAARFIQKTRKFLNRFASPSTLSKLTAFSLPEGRDPPMIDEWVFLSFENSSGGLRQLDITLDSVLDGRVLFNYGKSMLGTQNRDDPAIYDHLKSNSVSDKDKKEIEESVFLWTTPSAELREKVASRSSLLVPNTSCASCHKMNDDKFQFHNLSYFEDRSISVSPRVTKDTELDLLWMKTLSN
jgi:hypothetical protein